MTISFRKLAMSSAALGCGWLALMGAAVAQGQDALVRDLSINQRPVYNFVQQQAQAPRPQQLRIQVQAWTDRSDTTYRLGEPLAIHVRAQQDAFITVVNIGTSGRATVLLPNQFQRETRVRAGQVLTIGGPGANYQLVPTGPTGVEIVHVVASSRPLTLPELSQLTSHPSASPFLTLGRDGQDVTRDLAVQATGPEAVAHQVSSGSATLLIRVLPQAAPTAAVTPPTSGAAATSAELLALMQHLGLTQAAPQAAPAAAAPIAAPAQVAAPPAPPAPSVATATVQTAPGQGVALPAGFTPPPVIIRTDRSVYGPGDNVQISVAALADCRLTIMNVGPTGNITQLFPNEAQPDGALRAGQVMMVPPPAAGISIRPSGAHGMETIVGICASDSGERAAAGQRDLAVVAPTLAQTDEVGGGLRSSASVYFVR